MRVDLRYRTTTIYELSMINTTIDLCTIFNDTSSHKILDLFFDMYGGSFPKATIHPCPYFGRHSCPNMALSRFEIIKQFPLGIYKLITHFFDDKDEHILHIVHEIQSRNTFKQRTKKTEWISAKSRKCAQEIISYISIWWIVSESTKAFKSKLLVKIFQISGKIKFIVFVIGSKFFIQLPNIRQGKSEFCHKFYLVGFEGENSGENLDFHNLTPIWVRSVKLYCKSTYVLI